MLNSTANLELIEYSELYGEISLADGDLTSGSMGVNLGIRTFDENGELVGYINSSYVSFSPLTNSTSYTLNYTAAPPGGSYRIVMSCTFNCGSYLISEEYLQDDGSLSIENNFLNFDQLESSLDLVLTKQPTPIVVPDAILDERNRLHTMTILEDEVAWMRLEHPGGELACYTFDSYFNPQLGLFGSEGLLIAANNDFKLIENEYRNAVALAELQSGTYYLSISGYYSTYDSPFVVRPGSVNGDFTVECKFGSDVELLNTESFSIAPILMILLNE